MKSIIRITLVLLIINCSLIITNAQVAINSDGASPDASAMLDVTSTSKGILVPRMDSTSRQGISGPANGLLVFDTDFNSFWYYTNSTWLNLNAAMADADNDTKIQIEKNPDEDIIRFDLGGTERLVIEENSNGATLLSLPNSDDNIIIGEGAGTKLNPAFWSKSSGYGNNFIGAYAGHVTTTGHRNLFAGAYSGYANTTGENNIFAGHQSGYSNTSGVYNNFIGANAGYSNTSGDYNCFIGGDAGFKNTAGQLNVFLGYSAGYYEESSNKLYIENSSADSTQALIYGDFDADSLQINGQLSIYGAYKFPITDGSANQVLVTDGSGTLSWTDAPDDQTLSLENDTLTISNGNAIDLSELRTIDSDGLTIVIEPTSILDVEQALWSPATSTSDVLWQSFIPNYSGYLSQFDLNLDNSNPFDGGVFSVYDGTGIGGTLLFSKAIGSLGDDWQSIDLSDDSISLVMGNTYTIALEDTTVNSSFTFFSYTDVYSDGVTGIGNTTYSVYDLAFRTYYMAESDVSTNILTVNSSSSDNITYNLSNIDTLHFSDGTNQSSASHNVTQNIILNDFWLTNDGDNEGITITNDGAVGIGTSPTNGKLEISGSIDNTINGYTYVSNIGNSVNYVSSNTSPKEVSIYASDRIVGKFVISLSDERIKDIQGISDSKKDLAILNQIQITDYQFKDNIREGNTQQKKVIAQQVAEVFPQAVEKQTTEIIPDIYQTATIDENGWVVFNEELKIENGALQVGDKVQILFDDKKELLEVLEVNENAFKVKKLITNHQSPITNHRLHLWSPSSRLSHS